MRYRSNIEILGQILQVANGSNNATKTKIMHRAFLGYNQLKDHLMPLTERDLLRYDKHTPTLKTTEKGLRFLEIYNQMDEMLKVTSERQ
jgi:predicted transcriptional regulator